MRKPWPVHRERYDHRGSGDRGTMVRFGRPPLLIIGRHVVDYPRTRKSRFLEFTVYTDAMYGKPWVHVRPAVTIVAVEFWAQLMVSPNNSFLLIGWSVNRTQLYHRLRELIDRIRFRR